jgi:carbon monoxide dehydrogenase subunit G
MARRPARVFYLVPDELELLESVELEPDGAVDGDPEVVESLEGLRGAAGVVVGGGTVGGDAEGARSPGRSLTDPVPLSVQPAMSVAPSARADRPSNAVFMEHTSTPVFEPSQKIARRVPRTAAVALRALPVKCSPRRTSAMKIEGVHEVTAPRPRVWEAFMDPAQLKKAIPGCEKLEAVGEDEYKATMKIGVAAVKGTFEGKVKLFDKKPTESYRMSVEGSGGPGFVRGETAITLTETATGTRVAYSADVQVGGLIAGVGQRMLGGVSKMMADQFFNRMSEQLQSA